jgi:cell pole-organizing protein PopZ
MWLLVIFFILALVSRGIEEKKRLEVQSEDAKRRKEAEDYIMNSGDTEAIKTMMLVRANPSMPAQFVPAASSGNSALNTVAGVAAGVVVGEAVAGAVAASALSQALEDATKADN